MPSSPKIPGVDAGNEWWRTSVFLFCGSDAMLSKSDKSLMKQYKTQNFMDVV